MKKRRYIIPSLLAAGFSGDQALATVPAEAENAAEPGQGLIDVLRLEHEYHLAGHSSHRSHSSHSSHRSHRSSSGSTGLSPTRNYDSTPPFSVLPSSPAIAPAKTLPGNTEKFKDIARQVQMGLYTRGYYTGVIDGIVGPQTRAAVSKFQKDYGLPVTGTITSEVLDALSVAAH